jgi:glutathione S-transferase
MAAVVLYELAGADPALRFSPYCWRTRLALAHKALPVTTVAWRYHEREALAFSGQERVPVLVDGATIVADSWAIAGYLEQRYGERPSLFTGDPGPVRFVNSWADSTLHPALLRIVLLDIYAAIDARDRDYFRASRERRYGATLEAHCADGAVHLASLRAALLPLEALLAQQPYLAGAAPAYADYVVAGTFQWIRCIGGPPLAAPGGPVARWWQGMLEAFDGLLERAAVRAERTP